MEAIIKLPDKSLPYIFHMYARDPYKYIKIITENKKSHALFDALE